METFKFLYLLLLCYKLYSLTDNLSKALQKKKRSAVSGQKLARDTIVVFKKMRSDTDSDLFFSYATDATKVELFTSILRLLMDVNH